MARGPVRTKAPREHVGESGFAWTVAYPDRTSVGIGDRKPLATISLGSAEDGEELSHIPLAVARALDASDGPTPSSRAELLYLIGETARACAFQRVVDMVSRREYASLEATQRLVTDGYARDTAERAVSRAVELGILDDGRYASAYVRSKVACGWGPRRIGRELERWGLSLDELPGWPDEFLQGDGIADRARELLSRRRVPEKNAYAKLMRLLLSKGYSSSVARDVVTEFLQEGD